MKKKILRIQENTIFWKFGYFCEDISRKEPGPPTVTGLNSQQHLTTLIEARAILCGNQGQLKLEFKIPTVKLGSPEYEFIEKILCDKAKKITEDQPLPQIKNSGLSFGFRDQKDKSKIQVRDVHFKFSPFKGEDFTMTVAKNLKNIFAYFIEKEKLEILPIPSVSCKTFWQIGNNKVPFGVAIALDVYKNGAFKKIQKVQRTDGIEAACRLYEQFYRELSNDDILSDIKGAEILVGRHISSFSYRDSSAYYWTLIIDGYPHRRGNSFGAVKADGWKDIAEDFSSAMRECGIRGYKLVNGIRLENKKRITESKLTPSELYWLTTIMNENDCFSTE